MKHTNSIIIADLHLKDDLHLFQTFCTEIAPKYDNLFILGDLFNMYLGDDLINTHYQQVVNILKQLSLVTKIFIMTGNRDFLISDSFAQQAGIILIKEPFVLDNFVLIHGDSLVSSDKSYQRLKACIQHPLAKYILNHLPVSLRTALASKIKTKSSQFKAKKPLKIMDVNDESLLEFMQKYPNMHLIHGHTHRKNIHNYDTFKRYVLGDWGNTSGNFLQLKDGEISAIDF